MSSLSASSHSESASAHHLGKLTGVGVGPGDPDLITVKALRILQSAPVVAFPAGRQGQPGMAEKIIHAWLKPGQILLPLEFSFARQPERLQAAWEAVAAAVWPYLERGQDVVFASEGDISFYSTFAYLAQTLRQHHPEVRVQAVPGVCSPMAAAAVMGHPLTVQGEKLAILPALYSPQELRTALGWADVVVLMKVSSVYSEVWEILQAHDLLQQSYVITHIGHPQQQCYQDLSHHPQLELPYFSLLVVQVTANRLA